MRDIASRAGVSVMTVSLALRNSRRISDVTRNRIQSLADKMGFQPDPALRALVTYRHGKHRQGYLGTIAYLNNYDKPSIVSEIALHRNLFQGARQRAGELGFQVEEFWLREPGLNPKRMSEILISRGIQGLLIGPQPEPHAQLSLDWKRFATVQLGFSLESPRFHTVITDQFQACLRILQELSALGYRRIGLIIHGHQDERTENRFSGAYLAFQQKLPAEFHRVPILSGVKITEPVFRRWFQRHQPDALIGPAAVVTLPCIKKLKLRIPQNLGYALSYHFEQGRLQFAHSEGRQETAGALAAEHLSSMLARNELGVPEVPVSILISPGWFPGNTLRKVGPPVPLS